MKVLVTGFEPFGGEKINPAWEGVQKLEPNIEGAEIIKVQIPTVFGKSINELIAIIEKVHPDIVICVGQAGGRSAITVERVAINTNDAVSKDNAGNQPVDKPIVVDGPVAYFANLPIKKIVQEIQNAKIPASVSNTAGTFVCNQLFYGLMHYIDTKNPKILGGFIHIPFIPEQVINKKNMPSMALDDIVRGLDVVIRCAVQCCGHSLYKR
ncbi:MAG TPA: pyroglutamyl-peptidase I [Firmicutes bacterium]|nr:pyroglutamyl-peptidase I [Bacillota bacterium]